MRLTFLISICFHLRIAFEEDLVSLMIYVAKNRIELHIAHEKEEPADAQLVLVFSFVREVIDALSQEGRKFEWSGVCEENWRDLEQL